MWVRRFGVELVIGVGEGWRMVGDELRFPNKKKNGGIGELILLKPAPPFF
ncbi:hypothetical protein SLEP1_g13272 [Rubroshorea leprosula]|uniref:Uncharacterized protein n=1 Tax=Rubroshorea leprosula TaxID=152421 RepID=A0AAV5IPY2_9ROSI|nr:hypothetical protein SLEP1_g13272 [Rubroshorea leprosula]